MSKHIKLAIASITLAILLYPFFQAHEQAVFINKICGSDLNASEIINAPDGALDLLHRECEGG